MLIVVIVIGLLYALPNRLVRIRLFRSLVRAESPPVSNADPGPENVTRRKNNC